VRNRRQRETERGRIVAAIIDHPREFVGLLLASAASATIAINALFMQTGPHPAPIFAPRAGQVVEPRKIAAEPEITRSRAQIIADIQRELTRRGFYEGAADGVWGAKTDSAVRDLLQAAALRMSSDPNEALLRAIVSSTAKKRAAAAEPAPARKDQIAEMLAPPNRLLAVQRALADFGYGQIRPSGVLDNGTQDAISKFERDHSMPVTGQMSDQLVREMATMTGRPLE
jgi:peptidoglycan hydrolase-like protein with peptidoglycan-binding domain